MNYSSVAGILQLFLQIIQRYKTIALAYSYCF